MVKLVGRDDCSRCLALKNILSDRGVEFSYSDVSGVEDQGVRDAINNLVDLEGSYELPVILDVENKILTISQLLN